MNFAARSAEQIFRETGEQFFAKEINTHVVQFKVFQGLMSVFFTLDPLEPSKRVLGPSVENH